MRLPHPPPGATRFFARPLSAYMECPRCGTVLYFRTAARGAIDTLHCTWDPRTSRLQCDTCKLVLVIGVMAWPVAVGGISRTAPRDQVPAERELAQFRAMQGAGAGWWMPKDYSKRAHRPDDTNVTAKCTCKGAEDTDPDCPLHGFPDARNQTNEDPWPR